jgi:rhamnopyranosyl-N-acetylglucosaminyl-diphospho-decaprenol beta-1,3/1,4-galactofuranosyltransferase
VSPSVTAVVVTHNRLDLLRQCLAALRGQTRPADRVLVVDNASSDGTAAALEGEASWVDTLPLPENLGATGGFYEGMRAAVAGDAEWLWLLDDDTIPQPEALERLLAGLERAPADRAPAILASRVVWRDGRPHPMNQPILRRRDLQGLVEGAGAGLLPLRAGSWVSLFVSRAAVDRHGLPNRRFFYQADDIEYTARVLRREHGFAVPDSVVEHRTKTPHDALSDPDDRRFYFHARNTVFMLRGAAWAPREKPALAWVLVHSAARYMQANRFSRASAATVLRALRDGLGPLDDS